MGADFDFEIEYQPPGIETVRKVVTVYNPPAMVPMGQERTQWEIATSNGNLGRKPKWRWFGRYAHSNIRPSNRKSWQSGGN